MRAILPTLRMPDPSYFVTVDGKIEIYGTAPYFYEFHDWNEFLFSDRDPKVIPLKLYERKNSETIPVDRDTWDNLVYRWPNGVETLYVGHTATGEPRDRRIFAARRLTRSTWMIDDEPLLYGDNVGSGSWLGHSYGHHFFTDPDGEIWLLHDKVTADQNGKPQRTEHFARKMLPAGPGEPYRPDAEEIPVRWTVDPVELSTALRSDGTRLIEGPRPHSAIRRTPDAPFVYGFGFSAGAWNHENDYGSHYASTSTGNIAGPYEAEIVAPQKGSQARLRDRLKPLRDRSLDDSVFSGGMKQGIARPLHFIGPDGTWWAIGHASPRSADTDNVDRRALILVPEKLKWRAADKPYFVPDVRRE